MKDLLVLARTNSTLQQHATPRIYSRFHLKWPRSVQRQDVDKFRERLEALAHPNQSKQYERAWLDHHDSIPPTCAYCGAPKPEKSSLRLVPNSCGECHGPAMHIRSFALTNSASFPLDAQADKVLGPAFQEALAEALRNMPMLESFTWDDPEWMGWEIWGALSTHKPFVYDRALSRAGSLKRVSRLRSIWIRCSIVAWRPLFLAAWHFPKDKKTGDGSRVSQILFDISKEEE